MRRIPSKVPQHTKTVGPDKAAPTRRAAFSICEVCNLLGVGRSRLYQEIREGRLRVIKLGRRTLIRAAEVEGYLDRLERVSGPTSAPPRHAHSMQAAVTAKPLPGDATKAI